MDEVAAARWRVLTAVTLVVLAAAVGAGAILRGLVVEPAAGSGPAQQPPPTTTPLSPDEQPGPRTVTFTEGAADHPDRDGVRALLQGHFDAINLRDYRRWATTVISDRVATTSKPGGGSSTAAPPTAASSCTGSNRDSVAG